MNKLFVRTARQERAAYLRMGDPAAPKLLFIHGNVSASGFYLPAMERLCDRYDVIALDLNGYGETGERPIAAASAFRDWSEDIGAFADALGLGKFALCGWSLGGGIVLKYAISHADRLTKILLISPISPFGFGGSYDEDGKVFDARGLGCSGGFVNPDFLKGLREKDRSDAPNSPRFILNNHYFKPGFRATPELEELFLSEMLSIRLGDDYYAGNVVTCPEFPYVLPGERGINNSFAPQYANVSAVADIPVKPDILWFRGDSDVIVSDQSFYDLALLGKMGLLPGYPGEDKMPPQPMVSQMRWVLRRYERGGGRFEEFLMKDAGHGCHIEKEDEFVSAIRARV